MRSNQFKDYISLVKPGIIRGNLLTVVAGFLLASSKEVNLAKLIAVSLGTSLIIGSACAFNNYIDRDIDKKMKRTEKRPLADGRLPTRRAILFASLLLVLGVFVLVRYVNALVCVIGLVGFFDYVVLYSYFKRRSTLGTLIGGISGATPPLAGYVAVTGHIDKVGILLFVVLTFWQMPHFFAIALFRESDYRSAGLPVHPIVKGHANTKLQIMLYTFGFGASVFLLGRQAIVSSTFTFVMLVASLLWLIYGLNGYKQETVRWAKGMFRISLVELLLFSVLLAANSYLP